MGFLDSINPLKAIKKAVNKAITAVKKEILKPFKIVDDLVSVIERVVCFITKFHVRTDNIKSGVSNIKYGLITFYLYILKFK